MPLEPRQRFLAACRREPVDRAPAWMMRQAGRYLPEYQEVRRGHDFLEMVHRPELAAEVTCQPIRRFGMDAAVVFCDILVPPEAMGLSVRFVEGKGPVIDNPVRTDADVAALADFDPLEKTGFLAETLRRVRDEIGEERAIVGFAGAPFTLASYAIEGGGSRNYEHTKQMMLAAPETFDRLLARIAETTIPYLEMQVEAGADVLQLFDSWGGALDAATWRERIAPHVTSIVKGAQATGVPVILYVNGCHHLLEAMADTGADVLSIDWRVPPAEAIQRVGARVALQGNMDPCTLFAPPEVVTREAQRVLDAFSPAAGHIFNLGSGILPKTPVPSVAAMFETVLGTPAEV